MTQDTTLAEAREALATTLSNADLDGPDPDDYWEYLASKALAKLDAMPDRIAELESDNARLRELLQRVFTQSRVGDGKRAVKSSSRVNYPSTLFHELDAALKGEG